MRVPPSSLIVWPQREKREGGIRLVGREAPKGVARWASLQDRPIPLLEIRKRRSSVLTEKDPELAVWSFTFSAMHGG